MEGIALSLIISSAVLMYAFVMSEGSSIRLSIGSKLLSSRSMMIRLLISCSSLMAAIRVKTS